MDDRNEPCLVEFRSLHQYGAEQTESLFDRLEAAGKEAIERRPAPNVWSAEENVRHLLWIEDTLLRVECLGLDPYPFEGGIVVLPGQALERHVELSKTRRVWQDLRARVAEALDAMTADLLSDTVEDSGGRTVERNLARYLDLSAGARAAARQALKITQADPA